MIQVKSYKELTELKDVSKGETGAVEIEKDKFKLFVFDGKEWKTKTGKSGINMSYYEMNKQMISQLPDIKINEKKEIIEQYFSNKKNVKYFMLLCNDLNYYTVFNRVTKDADITIEDAFCDIIENSIFTKLRAIDNYHNEESALSLEIWFLDKQDNAHVAYLFPYDGGVIECI